MKVYKTIYRLDYPINYSMIDKLGLHADKIAQDAKKMNLDLTFALNLPNHIVTASGHQDEDYFMITVTPQTVTGVIEHYSSCNLNDLHSHPVVQIGGNVIKEINHNNDTVFLRYGLRVLSISSEGLCFESVLKNLAEKNKPQSDSLSSSEFNLTDIAMVLESVSENNDHNTRIQFGPYKQEENSRYFSLKVDKQPIDIGIKEGLIIDADIWQINNKIKDFDLPKYSRYYIYKHQQLIEKITKSTALEVKK